MKHNPKNIPLGLLPAVALPKYPDDVNVQQPRRR
jgi:hypothetical protein